jgi:hypothetical protein
VLEVWISKIIFCGPSSKYAWSYLMLPKISSSTCKMTYILCSWKMCKGSLHKAPQTEQWTLLQSTPTFPFNFIVQLSKTSSVFKTKGCNLIPFKPLFILDYSNLQNIGWYSHLKTSTNFKPTLYIRVNSLSKHVRSLNKSHKF